MTRDLNRYLDRLYATIRSRREIVVEELKLLDQSRTTARTSELSIRLRFWDQSLLQVYEALLVQGFAIVKSRYRYHYQRANHTLVFRYDNAPHYPNLPRFPEHKHEGERVISAPAPDLSEVLKEIDEHLYSSPSPERAETVSQDPG
jgi:hypothetical protein